MIRADALPGKPLAIFVAACFAGAELARLVAEPMAPSSMSAFWFPTGVLVAALLLAEARRWAAFVLTASGAMLVSMTLVHGHPLIPSLVVSVMSGVDACVTAWLVRRTVGPAFALDRVPHALALVICAIGAPAIGGLVASGLLVNTGTLPVMSVWRGWWLAEAIGILIAAPLAIAAVTDRQSFFKAARSWKALEVAIVLTAGAFLAEGIFAGTVDPLVRVPAYILPFLLWPVFRFGPFGASFASLILSFIALWHAGLGQGPWATPGELNLVLRAQGGVAIASISILLLASVVAERKRVAHERGILVAELQIALAEIKTLRGFIPICAWCHKVRDDAGFWQQLEMYLDARTDATFSHGICPSCAEEQHEELTPPQVSGRPS